MKKSFVFLFILIVSAVLASCAYPPDRYNTQRGALVGAGAGALLGQAIGHNTGGTLIGLAAGTILGGLVGNAVDQDYQAARDAAQYQKPVIYYDKNGAAVEAIPGAYDQKSNCRKVTRRTWKDGQIVSETVEEICNEPGTVVAQPAPQYVYPAPPPTYVYPYPYHYYPYYPYPYPGVYLRFGGPHYRHGYHRW